MHVYVRMQHVSHDGSLSVVCQKGPSSEICPFLPFVEKLSVCEAVLAIWWYRNRWGTLDLFLAAGQSFHFLGISSSHISYIQCWMFIVAEHSHLVFICPTLFLLWSNETKCNKSDQKRWDQMGEVLRVMLVFTRASNCHFNPVNFMVLCLVYILPDKRLDTFTRYLF